MTKTRIIFMGTPAFSVTALRSLVEAGYPVIAVYSQPPRPSGRGYHMTRSPVHEYAESVGIPVYTPKTLRVADVQATFKAHEADLGVVAAYGLILPREILNAPKLGCINIHASLLPRWRGAAPIQRAIMAGDSETGITIMQMDEGLDTGAMLCLESVSINNKTTTPVLHDQLSELGARLVLKTIPLLVDGRVQPVIQPEEGVTYAHKLSKDESQVNWQCSAEEILCKINALYPWPGVYFIHQETILKVAAAEIVFQKGEPGEVIGDLIIACGEHALKITRIQKPGAKWLSAEEFLRGYDLGTGTRLELKCPVTS